MGFKISGTVPENNNDLSQDRFLILLGHPILWAVLLEGSYPYIGQSLPVGPWSCGVPVPFGGVDFVSWGASLRNRPLSRRGRGLPMFW
jgi:hypothetical protein